MAAQMKGGGGAAASPATLVPVEASSNVASMLDQVLSILRRACGPTLSRGSGAAMAFASIGIVASFLYWRRARKNQEVAYELGDLNLRNMTPKVAKQLLQKEKYTSLIPDVMHDLEETGDLHADTVAPSEEVDQRAAALQSVGAPPFKRFLEEKGKLDQFRRGTCEILQLNIGLYCNQACTHCHVESSPMRKEMMSLEVVEQCLKLIRNSPSVHTLDITGGAPELNKGFKPLVEGAVALRDSGVRPNLRIIDRCNLTVLFEPGQEKLADYLAEKRVEVVASLPSYEEDQTDKQRGRKVFERSIKALQLLNTLGYGKEGTGLHLELVFNPPGAFLPPQQNKLESQFKEKLMNEYGIEFTNLIAIANMPVKRFFDYLRKNKLLEGYMDLLVRNFNPNTVPVLMCKNTVSVGWDGHIYDCDFNQQLELTLSAAGKKDGLTVFDLQSLDDKDLQKLQIRSAAHCYGCTAGQGSG